MDVVIGDTYSVNLDGDIYMCWEARPFLRRNVVVVQRNKNGMYLVRLPDGRSYSFAKRNISPAIPDADKTADKLPDSPTNALS